MHTNTTRATQNATFPRRSRRKPALYQHILSDLAVEPNQLKTPVSPTTPTKTQTKNNTKCPIAPTFLKAKFWVREKTPASQRNTGAHCGGWGIRTPEGY
jgi:hypothetical protein